MEKEARQEQAKAEAKIPIIVDSFHSWRGVLPEACLDELLLNSKLVAGI